MTDKISRKLYYETLEHRIQNQKNIGNRNYDIGQWQNRKGTRQDKSRRFTGVYSTFHTLIQQQEVQKVTREM